MLSACNMPALNPDRVKPSILVTATLSVLVTSTESTPDSGSDGSTEIPAPAQTGTPADAATPADAPAPTAAPGIQPTATKTGNNPLAATTTPVPANPTAAPPSLPTATKIPVPLTLPPPTNTFLPPATPTTASLTDIISNDNTAEMLALINQARCGQGLSPLTANTQLANAAYVHSADMIINNFFSHTGSDGSTVADRVSRQGYPWIAVGENLAAGSGSSPETFNLWWDSSGHKANMLNPDFREAGLAHLFRLGSEWGHYWTLVFGSQGTPPLTCAEMGF